VLSPTGVPSLRAAFLISCATSSSCVIIEAAEHTSQVLIEREAHSIPKSHRAKLPACPQDVDMPARDAEAVGEFNVRDQSLQLIGLQ
jgi:hypothetical protein